MAKYLTQEDLMLPLQASAFHTLPFRAEVLDDETGVQVGEIQGIVSGTMSIAADSDVRRTANITIQPTLLEHIKLEEESLVWLNRNLRLYVGLWNFRTNDYKWYPLGTYVYTNTSGTYDATNHQLTVNLSDFVTKLNGTVTGNIGAENIKFPGYEEDPDTGEPITYYVIRDAVVWLLKDTLGITNVQIDDIGEYYGLEDHNDNWEAYREKFPQWNVIPYDLEYSAGTTVWTILSAIRDLYPKYEMYFDQETNTFVAQLVPTMNKDDIFLYDEYIQSVLISESTAVDMTAVRNVVEVWGQTFEPDFYGDEEHVTFSGDVFTATIEGYTKEDLPETKDKDESEDNKYYNGDTIALWIPNYKSDSHDPDGELKININELGDVVIYDESEDVPYKYSQLAGNGIEGDDYEYGALEEGGTYCFKVKRTHKDGKDIIKMYLLGQWKVHAVCVLTDGREGEEITSKDDPSVKFKKYSKEYFKTWYNVNTVEMMLCPDSPFTVQKIGIRNEVKTGDEYDKITSDRLAVQRAHWETWKAARLTDTINITTILLPWMDVNRKVTYKPQCDNEEHQYVIQSVSHDFTGYTTTLTMYRFLPLYEPKVSKWNTDID